MTFTATIAERSWRHHWLARFQRWLASRPTRRQRQATIDLRFASESFKRDLGLETLMLQERHW